MLSNHLPLVHAPTGTQQMYCTVLACLSCPGVYTTSAVSKTKAFLGTYGTRPVHAADTTSANPLRSPENIGAGSFNIG